jgi:transposase
VDTMQDSKKISRRRHSAELKAQVLADCAQPGASVAHVALSHGINANVVHKWRRLSGARAQVAQVPTFVPVALAPAAAAPSPAPDIRIELRHGSTSMAVTWPVSAASECAAWMRELLR